MATATSFRNQVYIPNPGVVKPAAPELLGLNRWTDGRNLRFRQGSVEKAPGYALLSANQLSGAVMRIATYRRRDGTAFLLVMTNRRLYQYNPTTQTFTDRSGVNRLTSSTAEHVGCEVLGDLFVWGNRTDGLFRWDGAAATDVALAGSPPQGMFLQNFSFRLFVGNLSGSRPFRVRWSDQDNPESWPSNNFLDVGDDPDEITAMVPITQNLMAVFKQRAIYTIADVGGATPFVMDKPVTGLGCLAYGCAVAHAGILYFLAHDNFYRWAGGGAPEPIGDEIKYDLFPNINRDSINECRVTLDDQNNEIYVSYPRGTSARPNASWVYNYTEGHWAPRDYPVQAMGTIRRADDTDSWDAAVGTWDTDPLIWDATSAGTEAQRLIFGDSSGFVYEIGTVYTFNGAAYTSYVTTGQGNPTNNPELTHVVDRLRVISDYEAGTNVDVYLGHGDRAGTMSQLAGQGVSQAMGGNFPTTLMAFPKRTARVFNVTFRNDRANEAFRLEGYQLYFKEGGRN